MDWIHPEHPGRRVVLGYCLNLHPAEDLDGALEGMRSITLPLRDRLGAGRPFGVGLWLPAAVAHTLAAAGGAGELSRLQSFLRREQLVPFTFNAFPFGGFHREGLKADVYRPTWQETERVDFTLAVARVAARLFDAPGARDTLGTRAAAHVSISTHPGSFAAWVRSEDDLEQCMRNFVTCAQELARIEAQGGPRVVLSLEAEPRASAGDSRELADFLRATHEHALPADRALLARHLGTCLDCCHSAVEFEAPEDAWTLAQREGPLGKIQFSSALELQRPGERESARRALLAMDEPRYLHQVTGARGSRLQKSADLPDLSAQLAGPEAEDWLRCSTWRCHFHVPVDLEAVGEGLGTTRAHADRLLSLALVDPVAWSTEELHVEIETYTWDVLPGAARGAGDLVDGLEREYRHVMGQLESAGWSRTTGA